MTSTEIEELKEGIKQLRKEMIQTAAVTGLNSHKTLAISQKLDQLITRYQRLLFKKKSRLMNESKVV